MLLLPEQHRTSVVSLSHRTKDFLEKEHSITTCTAQDLDCPSLLQNQGDSRGGERYNCLNSTGPWFSVSSTEPRRFLRRKTVLLPEQHRTSVVSVSSSDQGDSREGEQCYCLYSIGPWLATSSTEPRRL